MVWWSSSCCCWLPLSAGRARRAAQRSRRGRAPSTVHRRRARRVAGRCAEDRGERGRRGAGRGSGAGTSDGRFGLGNALRPRGETGTDEDDSGQRHETSPRRWAAAWALSAQAVACVGCIGRPWAENFFELRVGPRLRERFF
jgi:hypothetical protein